MKKTVIALAIAGFAAATVAQAAPQANTFYAGAKAGWASFHHGDFNEDGIDVKRNSVTYGVFGGYQITKNFAVEAGYDYFGRVKVVETDGYGKHTAHGAHLTLKASYPVLSNLDVYARAGAALVHSRFKSFDSTDQTTDRSSSSRVSPVFAGGVEYAITPSIAARVEYQWLSRVRDKTDAEYRPDVGSVTLGLSYRFGQGAAPAPKAEVVSKKFTLNNDVTFGFGKSTLKPEASATLDGIYGEIAQVSNVQVDVAGYADRIGDDASNLKLSQRRAETVANYLVGKGVAQSAITATGHGEANPATGNTCDAVKGRKALIACLAPDRRVEVSVKGNK